MRQAKREGWAVITGATSGIGLEFTRHLARQGYQLLLVARRGDRLYHMKKKLTEHGVTTKVLMADLATEYGREMLIRWMQHHDMEVFINNAGFGLAGSFLETDVLRELVLTEDKQAVISERLSIRVKTLQDYVTRLYRKTGAATRAGLTDLYHENRQQR